METSLSDWHCGLADHPNGTDTEFRGRNDQVIPHTPMGRQGTDTMKLGWSAASFAIAASLGLIAIRPDVFCSVSLHPVSVEQNGSLFQSSSSPVAGTCRVSNDPKIGTPLSVNRNQRQPIREIVGDLGHVQGLKYPGFQEWYFPPMHCLEAKDTGTITQCIAHKATAWRDFDELWMQGKLPPGAWEADIGILARTRSARSRW